MTFLITAGIIVLVNLLGFGIAALFHSENDRRITCYVYAGSIGVLVGLLVDRW